MKSFLISNSRDTWVGLSLAGINGILVRNRNEALESLKNVIEDKDVGILILNERVADMINDEVRELKLKYKIPLIIEIPDRKGSIRESSAIADYIRASVGIRIWGSYDYNRTKIIIIFKAHKSINGKKF